MERIVLLDEEGTAEYSIEEPRWCSDNMTPLSVTKLMGIHAKDIDTGDRSLWRYNKAFPIDFPQKISLGEGCTPLISQEFRNYQTLFKLEWFSPTGSFKDRGASLMMSLLKSQGITEVVEDSSGNGGAAVAAYGAAAGIKVNIAAPANTSDSKIAQIKAYGADVHLIPGPREETERAALKMAKTVFYASHNWHPFFLQGTKTLGYELWEDLNFTAPDNIIIPTGAGSNILGCSIAFQELKDLKVIRNLPRLFAAQPQNCSPIDAAFKGIKKEKHNFSATIAEGTAIKSPIRMKAILKALRNSSGGTVAIEEEDIRNATLELANKGLYAEPTCATAAAAFHKLIQIGAITEDEKTVVVLTGSGLKVTNFFQSNFEIN